LKALEKRICAAVESGMLVEPFNATMIQSACPGWPDRTYHVFVADHATGNGNANELLERVSFGLYRLYRPCPQVAAAEPGDTQVAMSGD
jgi:hypothetical protein